MPIRRHLRHRSVGTADDIEVESQQRQKGSETVTTVDNKGQKLGQVDEMRTDSHNAGYSTQVPRCLPVFGQNS